MPKARITNLRGDRRRLLGCWLSLWLDTALQTNTKTGKSFPGWSAAETRKVLLTLKDLREDCDENKADIEEIGGYNDIPYGREHREH
jgi:hypothetical protein